MRSHRASATSTQSAERSELPPSASPGSVGYLGEESMMLQNPSALQFDDETEAETAEFYAKTLLSTGAVALPSQMLVAALTDAYFEHIHLHQPLVDRTDFERFQSPLLVHSVCMLASAYGHRRGGISQLSAAKKYYLKAKLLLATEHERNKLVVLKALCLMTCRSMTEPTVICLDSLWHWLGAASRYAIHMGLHKEATYSGNQDAGTRRRMWWHLFNQDKLVSFCYGRPLMIHMHDTDVQPLSQSDFPEEHPDNNIFIERTKLCMIFGQLAEGRYNPNLSYGDIVPIGQAFETWVCELPAELTLQHTDSKPYRRVVSELHILYYACLLIYQLSLMKVEPVSSSVRATFEECVQTASHMIRVFEEIQCRNDVLYVAPINAWFCYLAGVVQIRARATFSGQGGGFDDNLAIVRTVLQELSATVPSSALVLGNLKRAELSGGTLPGQYSSHSVNPSADGLANSEANNEEHITTESLAGPDGRRNTSNILSGLGEGMDSSSLFLPGGLIADGNVTFDFGDVFVNQIFQYQ
ncbi:uncharacterized protein Z519_04234 [Cladophialophora bantiana CBS 173.52]|uniref:Xylanolytic transcriptional activator regulatory domain-containing protein n=1 Tax=Cladophialophora bantiana (strain ATCC 10958 / CBS 173.52 / CDC B-1940 / NIH 8579) TaxID=1442370 RepID=A0A0D2IFV4_CLAB1|nr:uncharacterized protein Z519_04234 [Cladophialophora bantiana CBS 173.52]KIW95649.1 hypothetical protein Z519_04234 [Cladophialophora bantiana CBS 173.52]